MSRSSLVGARPSGRLISESQWQWNLRLFLVTPKDERNVTDSRDQFCRAFRAELIDDAVAGLAIAGANANLDQFMVFDRGCEFFQHGIREPRVSDHNDWIQLMAETAQELFLSFG